MKRLILILSVFSTLVCSCGPSARTSQYNYGDESVDIGYGRVRRSNLLGAANTVDIEKESESVTFDNIYDYLRARVPGVEISGDGGHGGAPTITVRGIRSINGPNEPLIMVDGAEVPDLSFISPNDVQSVTVLKDASLTVAYGSRGANGVILVTLKRR